MSCTWIPLNAESKQSRVMSAKTFTFKTVSNFQTCFSLAVRNKSLNSEEWLRRRATDLYVEKSKIQNYRCRSAFKLIEIDNKYKLLKPGLTVLDIGAAPGSWSQVLAERTNSSKKDPNEKFGLVIAVDLQLIHPIKGVIILSHSDFTKEATQRKILETLEEPRKFDCIFSDMAPASTGVKCLDQENIRELVYPVILFSVKSLKEGGSCLIKLWDCNLEGLKNDVSKFFRHFNLVKPPASYTSSSEIYLLARGFLGIKT